MHATKQKTMFSKHQNLCSRFVCSQINCLELISNFIWLICLKSTINLAYSGLAYFPNGLKYLLLRTRNSRVLSLFSYAFSFPYSMYCTDVPSQSSCFLHDHATRFASTFSSCRSQYILPLSRIIHAGTLVSFLTQTLFPHQLFFPLGLLRGCFHLGLLCYCFHSRFLGHTVVSKLLQVTGPLVP